MNMPTLYRLTCRMNIPKGMGVQSKLSGVNNYADKYIQFICGCFGIEDKVLAAKFTYLNLFESLFMGVITPLQQ